MGRKLTLVAISLACAGCGGGPREAPFGKAVRQTLTSTLRTNGKVEPVDRAEIRAKVEGAVQRIPVHEGSQVSSGQTLVEVEPLGVRDELNAAQARLAQARANLSVYESGGPQESRVEVENAVAKAQLELSKAREEAARLDRLVARDAATKQEAQAAHDRVRAAELEVASLEKRRGALAPAAGKAAAEAAVREAEASVQAATRRLEEAVIRSPMSGVLYRLSIQQGAYLHPGDEVGEVGKLDQLRATVYVDEPELGRVKIGQPVEITWDGEPGQKWQGKVERLPSEIVSLESRKVGEVVCVMENAGRALPPGANINAEIQTEVRENALTIPKEALRRRDGGDGVFVLSGDHVEWRPVEVGASSVTQVQIMNGLKEGEAVALTTDPPLEPGEKVQPNSGTGG